MSVKFKIGLTMDAETLFGLLAKFLPVDDLHVEEVIERPPPPAQHRIAPVRTIAAPRRKRRPSRPLSLNEGINRIIVGAMADGEVHRAVEFKPLLKKAGFSENSVGSRLQNLQHHGIVKQLGDGGWRLLNRADTTGAGPA